MAGKPGRRWTRAGRVGVLVAGLSLLLTGCSAHSFEAKFRFGFPTGVTEQAERVRTLWTWASISALIVGIVVWGLIFWVCVRYRKKDDELPRQTKYNLPIEVAYTIAPFLIIGALFFYTAKTESFIDKLTKNPDVNVQVDAFKWGWRFNYTADHGQATTYTGTTDPLSTVGSDNEIPILVIPRDETVRFDEHSEDVIHSFWVPEFLFKRDIIPYGTTSTARDNQFELTATQDGSYVGRCAELCGTYHSQMNFEVRVVEPSVYQSYLTALRTIGPDDPARQSKALLASGQGPVATTTHPFDTDRTLRTGSK